jgi:hypothetical protein
MGLPDRRKNKENGTMTSNVKLNGIEIARDADLTSKAFNNRELNLMLGGKYSEGQMSKKTRAALADEVRDLINEIPEPKAKTVRAKGEGKGARTTVSLNKACAASKKTNTIKALINGKKTEDQAREIYAKDHVLAEYWKTFEQDLINAARGIRPSAVRRTTIEVALEDGAGI